MAHLRIDDIALERRNDFSSKRIRRGLLSCVRNGPPRYWGIEGCEMYHLEILQHAETQGKLHCLSEILGIIRSLATTYYAPILAISQIITRKFMQRGYLLVYNPRNHTKKKKSGSHRHWRSASAIAQRRIVLQSNACGM
jgi:hypothetical protein